MVEPTSAIGLYAYATRSGVAAFDLKFGDKFWQNTRTRWLFGIDYGRTEPQAIRRLIAKPNTEIRIHDGEWLVQHAGLLPRRDYHPKTLFLSRPQDDRFGAVTGSGNFSSNGLRQSIEAGATLFVDRSAGHSNPIEAGLKAAENLWSGAARAEDVLDAYEERRNASFSRMIGQDEPMPDIPGARSIFWIETGYVTKNRGPERPGNQIDMPRGMARYFGIEAPQNLQPNSLIGEITFLTPSDGPVRRNLRLGNNSMEKITLPTPEEHGFDIYDGKILVFRRTEEGFLMSALEAAEFEAAFGDRLSAVMTMGSGRRYGHIEQAPGEANWQ